MSSKTSKEKFDQIIIETTQLKINIKSTGDLITKEYDLIPFHPNMAELRDLSNNSYILFPSFVKITMKDLKKAGVGEDYPKVFMNLDKYITLIRYVTSKDREEDFTLFIDRSQVKNYATALMQNTLTDLISDEANDVIPIQKYETLTDEEIITNNIELIKRIFLPVKSHFFILGNDYVIGQSKYIPKYVASAEKNTKLDSSMTKIPLAYTVTFELQLLDAANNPEAGNFSKMTCKAKKGNIAKDTMDIFGTNFGYVPEKRASVPSILNTAETTKNRQYGKLQKEWEERNKFVKAPTNERERLAIESKWTPLQRKMAEFDKKQEKYNKIPPLWIKETNDLDNKYTEFGVEMKKLRDKLASTDIESVKADIKADMTNLVKQLLVNDREKRPTTTTTITDAEINKFVEDNTTTFLTNAKALEQDTIDYKYVKPLIEATGVESKIKDFDSLKSRESNLRNKLKGADTYTAKSLEVELNKLQGDIVRKKAEIEVITKKFGVANPSETSFNNITGKLITKDWLELKKDNAKFKETIEKDKANEENKIKIESVNKELDTKLKEIKEFKKKLLLAKFYEGIYDDLSKEEKDSYEKKSIKERPLEDVSTLQSNLDSAKGQYLDIAATFSMYNRVQAQITLSNDDMTDFKKLRDAKRAEKAKKDKEKGEKSKLSSELKKHTPISPEDEKKIEILNKDEAVIQKEIDETITPILDRAEEKYKLYNIYIDNLKALKQNDETLRDKLDMYDKTFNEINNAMPETIKKIQDARTASDSEKTSLLAKKMAKDDEILNLKKDTPPDAEKIKKAEEEKAAIVKQLGEIDKKLEEELKVINKTLEDFKNLKTNPTPTMGGKLLRKTRKNKRRKKPSKRYILMKNKIKKTKSSRYQKKKYTLRRWRK
jgi:hypothetical protein